MHKGFGTWLGLLVVAAAAGAMWLWSHRENLKEVEPGPMASKRLGSGPGWTASVVGGLGVGRLEELEAERRKADETVWALEGMSHAREETVAELWDALRAATNRWPILEAFPWGSAEVPEAWETLEHGGGIRETVYTGPVVGWTPEAIRTRLEQWKAEGWEWVQGEFRHRRFEPTTDGMGRSIFHVVVHARRAASLERVAWTAEVGVDWQTSAGGNRGFVPRLLQIRELRVRRRDEGGMFVHQLSRPVLPEPGTPFIDPLLVEDLDGNGFPEIVLGCKNEVFRNRGGGRFEKGRLLSAGTAAGLASVVCDVTGDGVWDWVAADHDGVWVWDGARGGGWSGQPRRVWQAPQRLENPFVLSPGDVDGDGDLDLWLGQYKVPYVGGQMPTPYSDALDGFPGYLLIQGADGLFEDRTEAAGLARKRHRRMYSAVFADLDGDRDVDLSLVSDFAGLDVFWNDGKGVFAERVSPGPPVSAESLKAVTVSSGGLESGSALRGSTRAFGMAQAMADFNRDGRLDLLMIGMNSFTGERLAALGLGTEGDEARARARTEMSYGNRMYAGTAGGLVELAVDRELRETGWSWGVTTADFDNDGELDLYIVNGHKSRGTVRDYDRQFWMHDIEVGRSEPDAVRELYFQSTAGRLYGAGWSYGGFEKNRFLLGRGGGRFVEAGWLLDVSFEDDFRNIVGADLDGDGRVDLVGTTYGNWPEGRQGLHVFRNEWNSTNHWVGFRLRNGGRGRWTVGAQVTLHAGGREQRRWLVAGDSYRSQHPAVAHFGLGRETRVDRVDIRWPDGTTDTLRSPEVDRYHDVR